MFIEIDDELINVDHIIRVTKSSATVSIWLVQGLPLLYGVDMYDEIKAKIATAIKRGGIA